MMHIRSTVSNVHRGFIVLSFSFDFLLDPFSKTDDQGTSTERHFKLEKKVQHLL